MTYAALSTVQATDPGDILTAAWCDQVDENFQFFADPPACSVFNSTAVAVGNNTNHIMVAGSENYDNDAMHSTSSNTSRITVQTAGRYLAIATVSFAANATGNRQAEFYVNGVTSGGGALIDNAGASNSTGLLLVRMLVLSVGDYVEVNVVQRSGGNLNATLSEFSMNLMTL